MREANNLDLTLLIFLGVIWGSSFFNIKIATYSYEPFTLALIRVFFASIPLVLLCHYKNIKIKQNSENGEYIFLNIFYPYFYLDKPRK